MGLTAGVNGQQRMLTSSWHLLLPLHLSEVHGYIKATLRDFGCESRMFNFFIAIRNEGRDYIKKVIPHINNLISYRNSSYPPWIDACVLEWPLK
jgi:hypothetical protein